VFNVVIEKELDINNDPLIIKEDINDIVQSIEEQLYNINVSYRNHVRKIKNNIKSLEGVIESTFVILEDDNVNDDNLIYYLTNVLEISLDCVIATLCESREFKPQLSTVNSLTDLLQIDHPNITVCNQIIENCKELFNVYSEVNDKKLSSTAFYEILDESITRSVKRNEYETVTVEDFQEGKIYNLVIENLDTLVGPDLNSTYDNIKLFAANQVQESFITDVWGWFADPLRSWTRKLTGGIIGAATAFGTLAAGTWIAKYVANLFTPGANVSLSTDLSELKFFNITQNNQLRNIVLKALKDDKLSVEEFNLVFDTYKSLGDRSSTIKSNELEGKAFLELLLNEKGLVRKYNEEVSGQIKVAKAQLQSEIVDNTNLSTDLKTTRDNLASVQQELATNKQELVAARETLKSLPKGNLDELEKIRGRILELESAERDITQNLTKLQSEFSSKNEQLSQINSQLSEIRDQVKGKEAQLDSVNKSIEQGKQSVAGLVQEMQNILGETGFTMAAITAGVVGLGIVTYLLGILFIRGKIFLTKDSANTIKSILKLRKKIDALRKTVVVTFPELTVQFNFIDSEVKKCEQDSTRKNDVLMAYQCSMKYFMGSYALVMYSTLVQLAKDGGSLNSFNKLSDVHSYKGFATMTTRQLINELNAFYSLMIDYDATMSDAFESIFYVLKKQILENRGSDNIIKQLPNNLALGRV
jgi:methyl-accepting chemotaxis protein